MLEALPFTGTTRVANKGVDVALVVYPTSTESAIQAARICGVCGISTAVLEVTQLYPPDQRTLEHFCVTAGKLVFESETLMLAHQIPKGIDVCILENSSVKAMSDAVFAIKRKAIIL